MQNNSIIRPRYFALQWHITERCNWHCRHCYQKEGSRDDELPLSGLFDIFKQYLRLIRHFGTLGPARSRLVIAGGEPLLREDFFAFLERIHKYNKYFMTVLLTNGSLIDAVCGRRLKRLGVETCQVSLEGLEGNNDAVRGEGAFNKTTRAIEILVKSRIKVVVCLTLTKNNVPDIMPLIRLCGKLGVSQVGLRRLVPLGRADAIKGLLLQPFALRKVYLRLEKEIRKPGNKKKRPALVGGCDESIFCQEINRPLINCGVTEGRMLTLLPDGKVIPCRRLPLEVGDATRDDLLNIYYGSARMEQLRNLDNCFAACRECGFFDSCLSGARCISYSYFGRFSSPDPQCWKMFKVLPPPDFLKNKKDIISKTKKVHFTLLPRLFRQFDKKV